MRIRCMLLAAAMGWVCVVNASEAVKRQVYADIIAEGGPDAEWAQVALRGVRKSASADQLRGTATLSGTVSDAATMAGIDGHQVFIQNVSGTYWDSTFSDPSGAFMFSALPADTYIIGTNGFALSDYIDELYTPTGGYPCANCDASLVTDAHVVVAAAATVTGIDLELNIGATISGNVSSAGAPVADLGVRVLNTQYYPYTVYTDAAGNYTIRGLPDLEYRAYIERGDISVNLRSEVYPNIPCNPSSCSGLAYEGSGMPLVISGGVGIAGIDFVLETGAVIRGVVHDAVSMLPISETFGFALLLDAVGRSQGFVVFYGTSSSPPGNDGSYEIGGLLPGDYFIEASERENHVREVYPNVHCPWSGCDRAALGTAISLGATTVASGIDFYLDQGGHIQATIRDDATLTPIEDPHIYFQIIDAAGAVAGGGAYYYSGPYTGLVRTARPLPPGTYTVRTGNDFAGNFSYPYIDELYSSPPTNCVGYDCDLTSGTPVTVTIGTTNDIGNIDIGVGHTLSGVVTEIGSAVPIPDVFVLIYNDDVPPVFTAITRTAADGSFSVTGLEAGNYFVLTNNGSNLPVPGFIPVAVGSWVDILYNDQMCPGGTCDFHAIGDLVTVPPPRGAGIVIEQSPGAQISGRVTEEQGLPIAEARIDVYDDTGMLISSFFSEADGRYATTGLADGTYYLISNVTGAIVNRAYGGFICSNGCNWADATPVSVTEAAPATGVDFELLSNYIFGTGVDAQ